MRLPINRGFPVAISPSGDIDDSFLLVIGEAVRIGSEGGSTELIEGYDADTVYACTLQARLVVGEVSNTVTRRFNNVNPTPSTSTANPYASAGVRLGDVAVPDTTIPVDLFRDLPMRGGSWLDVTATAGDVSMVYGYLETGADIEPPVNNTLCPVAPVSPFTIEPVALNYLGTALLHTLREDSVDLVTLKIVATANSGVEIKFFDGTYTNGEANYVTFLVIGTDNKEQVVLDRHPMRGPGTIHATVSTGDSDTKVYIYGTVTR